MNNECTWSRILILILDDWTRSIENREKRKWVQAGWQDDTVAMRLSTCHMNSDVRNCRCFLQLQELTIRFVTRDFQAWNHIVNLIYIHLCLYIYLSISTYISRVCRTDLSSRRTQRLNDKSPLASNQQASSRWFNHHQQSVSMLSTKLRFKSISNSSVLSFD